MNTVAVNAKGYFYIQLIFKKQGMYFMDRIKQIVTAILLSSTIIAGTGLSIVQANDIGPISENHNWYYQIGGGI